MRAVSKILLQSTPSHVDIDDIKHKIIRIDGLISLHDLHIWQLVDGIAISSIHVTILEGSDFKHIASKIKKIFHKYGIHSTSIQPEFVQKNEMKVKKNC